MEGRLMAIPNCPECGARPVGISVGVVIETHRPMAPITRKPASAPRRIECGNGHWYLDDGSTCGPPEVIIDKTRGTL
jgi:hypothetical protein